jgi:hypothetical protein
MIRPWLLTGKALLVLHDPEFKYAGLEIVLNEDCAAAV